MVFLFAGLSGLTILSASQIPVRHPEGLLHGYLILRNLEGAVLASGELSQAASGNRITNELAFRFKDGSRFDQTTVFSQRRVFQLLSYRLVEKGPAFDHDSDMSLNAASGLVTVRYRDKDAKEKVISESMKLPPDLANGLFTTLLNDIDPHTAKTTVSLVIPTPKPRLVRLEITPSEEDAFSVAGASHTSEKFTAKMDLGGITGIVAPFIGKQPPEMRIWMTTGKAPCLLRMEASFYEGGPIWQIELASPVWPKVDTAPKAKAEP